MQDSEYVHFAATSNVVDDTGAMEGQKMKLLAGLASEVEGGHVNVSKMLKDERFVKDKDTKLGQRKPLKLDLQHMDNLSAEDLDGLLEVYKEAARKGSAFTAVGLDEASARTLRERSGNPDAWQTKRNAYKFIASQERKGEDAASMQTEMAA